MVNDLEATLPQALEHLTNGAPHRPDRAASARRGVRRRRILVGGPIAAAAAVLVVLGSVWVARGDGPEPASTAPSACRPLLTTPIPVWGSRRVHRSLLSALRLLDQR